VPSDVSKDAPCAACRSHGTRCTFTGEDKRRASVKLLRARLEELESLFATLQKCPADELPGHLARIRGTEPTSLKNSLSTPSAYLSSRNPTLEGDVTFDTVQSGGGDDQLVSTLSDLVGRLTVQEDGVVSYFGATSNLSLVKDPSPPQQTANNHKPVSMLPVGVDAHLIDHLLTLYW
jgi:hypothetical protein